MHRNSIIPDGKGRVFVRLFTLCCVLAFVLASGAGVAHAKKGRHGWEGGPVAGGYTGPGPASVSIQQALSMPDGSWVSIKGSISKFLGDTYYTITDSSGTATAKIGKKAWQRQNFEASDTVVFHGRVTKPLWTNDARIDVKQIIRQ